MLTRFQYLILEVKNEILESSEHDMLFDLGIENENMDLRDFLSELYMLCKTENNQNIISRSEFEQTISQFQDRLEPGLQLFQKQKCFSEWLAALGLIQVSNNDAENLCICPLTVEIISSSHN